jgi:hypothetical protein
MKKRKKNVGVHVYWMAPREADRTTEKSRVAMGGETGGRDAAATKYPKG